jgi:hypothetical protein
MRRVLVWIPAVLLLAVTLVFLVAVGAVHFVAGSIHRGTGWLLGRFIALKEWAERERARGNTP